MQLLKDIRILNIENLYNIEDIISKACNMRKVIKKDIFFYFENTLYIIKKEDTKEDILKLIKEKDLLSEEVQ